MYYIVLDMEWNQSYPRPDAAGKKRVRNEIIEIGAVKLGEDMSFVDTYKRLVRPAFIKRLNSHVKKLTGITAKMLESGGFFPDVIDEFRAWCGDDMCLITWGYDDVPMLISCLKMYGLPTGWVKKWYNLQVIFNAQTDGGSNQRSLKYALEYFNCEIDEERPWHDALNDACYTAAICRRLDLPAGIAAYGSAGAKISDYELISGLRSLAKNRYIYVLQNGKLRCNEAFNHNLCPFCGERMTRGRWIDMGRRKPVTLCECAKHGKFMMRLGTVNSGSERVAMKVTYECTPEAEAAYIRRLEKINEKTERKKERAGEQEKEENGQTV